jgi:hypothetical protein
MTKWALLGLLGFSLSLSAQVTQPQDLFTLNRGQDRALDFSRLDAARYGYPALTLVNESPLSLVNAYTWFDYTWFDSGPLLLPPVTEGVVTSSKRAKSAVQNFDDKTLLMPHKGFEVHGEVGGLYGHSLDGRVSRELEQGYIFGEIGNDKTQISVGAFYEHVNDRARAGR